MADPIVRAAIDAITPLGRRVGEAFERNKDQLPKAQQGELYLEEIQTNTRLSGANTNVEASIVDARPRNTQRFDEWDDAMNYTRGYMEDHGYSTRGMDEIWIKNEALPGYDRRRAKLNVGTSKLLDEGLDEAGKIQPGYIKLNMYDGLAMSDALRRSREAIPEDDIWEFFTKIGRRERAQDFIDWVKTTNNDLDRQVARLNADEGATLWSVDHVKALGQEGINAPGNRRLGPYSENVRTQHRQDMPDYLMKAQDVPFSWEEQILKWLDPTIGRFFGDLTDSQRSQLVEAVENIDQYRLRTNDPDLTPQELIHDLMEQWGHSPLRDHDEAIRRVVGGNTGNFTKTTQFPEQIQRHISRSQEIGIPEPSWKNGSIDYIWRPESNTGQIDIPPQSKKGFKGLRDEFFEQIEELPSGSIWELNPKFKDEKRRRIYARLFANDGRIKRNPDPTLGWVLRVP